MAPNGFIFAGALAATAVAGAASAWELRRQIRRRHLQCWIGSHVRQEVARLFRPTPKSVNGIDVLLCIADHFEPHAGGASDAAADARVAAWVERYPDLFGDFRDSDGRPPRHTFFYP